MRTLISCRNNQIVNVVLYPAPLQHFEASWLEDPDLAAAKDLWDAVCVCEMRNYGKPRHSLGGFTAPIATAEAGASDEIFLRPILDHLGDPVLGNRFPWNH